MILKFRPVEPKNFKDYKQFLDKEDYNKIKLLAKKLAGKKIVHINATPIGGGIVSILRSIIPLEQSLGLKVSWYAMQAPDDFYVITKKIHNSLQGDGEVLTDEEKKYYLEINKEIVKDLEKLNADIYFIHDPQPLASINFINREKIKAKFISRIHIDLSAPTKDTMIFFLPYMEQYEKTIFSMQEFVSKDFSKNKAIITAPAIDPLDIINIPMEEGQPEAILSQFGVHIERPIIAQVSRFDPWKDPVGVIEAYYMAKNDVPDLQLILAGVFEAEDDPEAKSVFEIVKKHAKGDPDIFLFAEPEKLSGLSNDTLTNAVQRISDVILQKSIKEGFALTVSGSMWKKKPVIGGNVGGIRKQIIDGETGFLVNSPKEAAEKIVKLVKDKNLRKQMGEKAHKRVKKHFLVTRHLKDHLKAYDLVLG